MKKSTRSTPRVQHLEICYNYNLDRLFLKHYKLTFRIDIAPKQLLIWMNSQLIVCLMLQQALEQAYFF